MITWANLRASAAPWLAIPILIYTYLYIDDVTFTAPSRYGVQSGESAAYAVAIIAPATAAAAAWEAGRHRRLGALRFTGQRSALPQFLRAASPVLTLLVVLVTAALMMAHHAVGVMPSGTGWLAAAHLIVISLGWLVIGWSLGSVLPRSIAAPAAGIGCWAWLSVPQATSNAWIRHLGGFIDGQSSVTDLISPAVYLVPWGVVAGLALAFWLLARRSRRTLATVLALAVATATLIVGHAAVADWGFGTPTHPRGAAPYCTGKAPMVCVPPEYEPYAQQLRQDALAPIERLKEAGIAAPDELRIASAENSLRSGIWPLYWSPPPRGAHPDAADFDSDFAESAVTGTAAHAGAGVCEQPGSLPAAWAALVVGLKEKDVQEALTPQDWATVRSVQRLPAGDQVAWFTRTAVNLKHCGKVRS
ncbi:hypothetical protein G3I19_18835 [Streptomyces sp. SID10853]|uniref:DUF7224 domain-containing protein n=1 Tax=Streptomyces sp. SID10853 TaxID=2706028 RepID=UPI0013C067D6|nr:hypothetical protein [Streptomyces sp. SID10853]NDZ80545.1 hypothetical protein [Streptomyces sp. SID10853]